MTDERYFPETETEAVSPPRREYRPADYNEAERKRNMGMFVPDVVAEIAHHTELNSNDASRLGAFTDAFDGIEQSIPLITAFLAEAEQHTSSPQEIIFPCVLGAGAIAGQGGYDVQIENEAPSAISLIVKTSASSGVGKTPGFRYTLSCIVDWVKEENERHQEELQEAKDKIDEWKSEREGILAAIRKNREKGNDLTSLKNQRQEHDKQRPSEPKKKVVLVADATPEALMDLLFENCTIGIASSEAERILNGPLMRDVGLLTEGWDGYGFDRWRVAGTKEQSDDPRFTLLLLGQQEAFDEHHQGKGAKGGYLGLHARTLFLRSQATPEKRIYFEGEIDTIATKTFRARIRQLLTNSFAAHAASLSRKVLRLSPEAVARWKQIRLIIDREMKKGGSFERTKDYASKLKMNIVRVAAVIHLIEGFEGNISLETLEAAHRICRVFSAQYLEIFMPKYTRRYLMEALDKELEEFRKGGLRLVALSYFLSWATTDALRSAIPLHAAANGLKDIGRISLIPYKRKFCIDLRPNELLTANEPVWGKNNKKYPPSG